VHVNLRWKSRNPSILGGLPDLKVLIHDLFRSLWTCTGCSSSESAAGNVMKLVKIVTA